jgi:RNA polymerase subunit RPABC4/transcription elongation factor Spt4
MGELEIEDILKADQPVLWVLPALVFTILILLSIVDAMIRFLPSSVSALMMLVASACVASTIASYITEVTRGRERVVYYTMLTTLLCGAAIYLLGQDFLMNNIASGINVASIPVIGEFLSKLTVTLFPGIFSGSIIGGVASLIPMETMRQRLEELDTSGEIDIPIQVEVPKITPDKYPGFLKACSHCGQIMPFDSLFCSSCGSVLKKVKASQVRFCRYCGNRIYFIGEFCPDCGREINLISKPKVYVSQ